MRSDMAKVMTENTSGNRSVRRGKSRKGARKRLNKEGLENTAKHESMSGNRQYGWDYRDAHTKTNVLRRFLLSRVGHKWDKVYSELNSVAGQDKYIILEYLDCTIATKVLLKNGIPHEGRPDKYLYNLPVYQDVYVHPDSGLICKTPRSCRKRRKNNDARSERYHASDNPMVCYAKDKRGIWYECFLVRKTKVKQLITLFGRRLRYEWVDVYNYYDVFLHSTNVSDYDGLNTYNLAGVYCARKRQLNKKEIKRISQQVVDGQLHNVRSIPVVTRQLRLR